MSIVSIHERGVILELAAFVKQICELEKPMSDLHTNFLIPYTDDIPVWQFGSYVFVLSEGSHTEANYRIYHIGPERRRNALIGFHVTKSMSHDEFKKALLATFWKYHGLTYTYYYEEMVSALKKVKDPGKGFFAFLRKNRGIHTKRYDVVKGHTIMVIDSMENVENLTVVVKRPIIAHSPERPGLTVDRDFGPKSELNRTIEALLAKHYYMKEEK